MSGEAQDNMRIWDQVCKTDPANTKEVKQRGGFTCVCAYSQFEQATRAFGPVGFGWGWTEPRFEIQSFTSGEMAGVLVVCHVGVWYEEPENAIHVVTSAPAFGKYGVDDDVYKKVLTDALTKALSYLGFAADVFQGKFDDNKYMAERRRETAQEATVTKPATDDGLLPANQCGPILAGIVRDMGLAPAEMQGVLLAEPYKVAKFAALADGPANALLAVMRKRWDVFCAMKTVVKGVSAEDPAKAVIEYLTANIDGPVLLAGVDVWEKVLGTMRKDVASVTA